MAKTSIEAYEYLKANNLLSQRQKEVLNALKELGKATSKEIAIKLNKHLNAISGRITELINLEMIEVIGRVKRDGEKTSFRLLKAKYTKRI